MKKFEFKPIRDNYLEKKIEADVDLTELETLVKLLEAKEVPQDFQDVCDYRDRLSAIASKINYYKEKVLDIRDKMWDVYDNQIQNDRKAQIENKYFAPESKDVCYYIKEIICPHSYALSNLEVKGTRINSGGQRNGEFIFNAEYPYLYEITKEEFDEIAMNIFSKELERVGK